VEASVITKVKAILSHEKWNYILQYSKVHLYIDSIRPIFIFLLAYCQVT
jgi:hypothetical protein